MYIIYCVSSEEQILEAVPIVCPIVAFGMKLAFRSLKLQYVILKSVIDL